MQLSLHRHHNLEAHWSVIGPRCNLPFDGILYFHLRCNLFTQLPGKFVNLFALARPPIRENWFGRAATSR